MSLKMTRTDARLVMEDTSVSVAEVLAMPMIFMRWGWAQADHEMISTLAYIATHPHLVDRIMAEKDREVELCFEPMGAAPFHLRLTIAGVALQPIGVSKEVMDWIMAPGIGDRADFPLVSERGARVGLTVWVKALQEYVRSRTEGDDVFQHMFVDEVAK